MAGNPQTPQPQRQRLLCPVMSTQEKPTACVEHTCALWSSRHTTCGLAAPALAVEAGLDELAGLIRDIRAKL